MQIRIIKGYRDAMLKRPVLVDEELTVTDARGQKLIDGGVAIAIASESDELKAAIAEKDIRIAELEAAIAEKDKEIVKPEKAAKKAE